MTHPVSNADGDLERALEADLRKEQAASAPVQAQNDAAATAAERNEQATTLSRRALDRARWGGQAVLRSVPEQAARLSISRSYAYLLVKTGKLKSVRLGRRVLVSDDAADELLTAGTQAA